jgi:AcrR family transcriptional regulator
MIMKVNTPDLAKSTPNTVSARKKDLVRELILDAAQRLLTKDASGGFSMRDLAGEADLSLVTPYKYFGSKNGVFRALVERVMLQIEKRYAAASEQGPVERVLSMLDAGVETLLGDAAAFKTIGNVISLPKSEEEHKDMFQPATRLWQLALKDNFPIADDLSGSTCDMLAEE